MDAITAALDALFADPAIAENAIWKPGGAEPGIPIRVIRRAPDSFGEFGQSRAVMASMLFVIRKVEAPSLAEGDIIIAEERSLPVLAEPQCDALGMVVTCEAP
jgi:hypothetical protein